MREIRFGLIGPGMMSREFASAVLRWPHLHPLGVTPSIVSVAGTRQASLDWFGAALPGVRLTTDYRETLDDPAVDAVYVAVPHHLHEQIYGQAIRAGKHLFGEKPFGIDRAANDAILAELAAHPGVFAACSSEFPFFPGAYRIAQYLREGRFGRIIDVEAGLWHSSDLDPNKPLNWKRMRRFNGEYGCLGDLGLHPLHIPLRMGWLPHDLRGLLSKIVAERPDGAGGLAPCDTWDNALLACAVETAEQRFPMTISVKRIAPGEGNTWFIKVNGAQFSAEYSTKQPKTLRTLAFAPGKPQAWESVDLGYQTAYPTITGPIFEFGFSDSMLQMIAAFCDELAHGRDGMRQPFYCATPEETRLHHRVLTAALESGRTGATVALEEGR